LESLPEGMEVGILSLEDSEIGFLPKGLKVNRLLNLMRCKNLTSLPKGLEVYGNLAIHNSGLAKFSDNELRKMVKPGFILGKIER
jgi:hypothetical protein